MINFQSTRLHSIADMFPLTARGVVCLLCVAFALRWFGYGAMDLVVFALGICALAILLSCLFSVIICGLILQRRIQREGGNEYAPAQGGGKAFEADFPNQTGFSLPSVGPLPLVRLQWSWHHPDAIDCRVRIGPDESLEEEITPRRRCLSGHVTRRFEVTDVLGLCRYSWRARLERECYALPRIESLKKLPLLHSFTAEDGIPRQSGEAVGDRMEIRPYVAGDSVRDILWKSYARTGQLNVRLRERSVAHGKRVLAYLHSSPGDEAAAAVARAALEFGAFGDDWLFSADGTETPCAELPAALRAVARSRALGEAHAPGLARFLAATEKHGATHCIVFAAADAVAELAGLSGGLFGNRFTLVLALDDLREAAQTPWWRGFLLRPSAGKQNQTRYLGRGKTQAQAQAHAPRTPGNREAIDHGGGSRAELLLSFQALKPAVASIILVDRGTGTCYDDNLRRL